MDDREIFIIEIGRRGRDGDYTGASEVALLKNRATALEARANITKLDDVPDVDAATPTNGQVLTWDGSAWSAATPASAVSGVTDSASVDLTLASGNITADVKYAGTGSASTAARSNHTHTNPAPTRAPFGPQGYMSSGTRSLGSTSVTLAAGISYVVKARLNLQMRGADAGACYYQLRLTINGNDVRTSTGGASGFWCVQGVPDKTTWEHHITMTGTGSAITVSAHCIYYGGGGFYTDAGEIVVEPVANR